MVTTLKCLTSVKCPFGRGCPSSYWGPSGRSASSPGGHRGPCSLGFRVPSYYSINDAPPESPPAESSSAATLPPSRCALPRLAGEVTPTMHPKAVRSLTASRAERSAPGHVGFGSGDINLPSPLTIPAPTGRFRCGGGGATEDPRVYTRGHSGSLWTAGRWPSLSIRHLGVNRSP